MSLHVRPVLVYPHYLAVGQRFLGGLLTYSGQVRHLIFAIHRLPVVFAGSPACRISSLPPLMPSSVFTRTSTGNHAPLELPALPLGSRITSALVIFMRLASFCIYHFRAHSKYANRKSGPHTVF